MVVVCRRRAGACPSKLVSDRGVCFKILSQQQFLTVLVFSQMDWLPTPHKAVLQTSIVAACCPLLPPAACSERVLMIPHPRNGQSINDMFNNRTEWMLVDRSKISFTGNECDKVRAGVACCGAASCISLMSTPQACMVCSCAFQRRGAEEAAMQRHLCD